MLVVSWPVGRGQKQPHIWNSQPKFAYSLTLVWGSDEEQGCIIIINLFAKAGCQWDNSPSSWPPMIINTILKHNYEKKTNRKKRQIKWQKHTVPTSETANLTLNAKSRFSAAKVSKFGGFLGLRSGVWKFLIFYRSFMRESTSFKPFLYENRLRRGDMWTWSVLLLTAETAESLLFMVNDRNSKELRKIEVHRPNAVLLRITALLTVLLRKNRRNQISGIMWHVMAHAFCVPVFHKCQWIKI